MYDSLGRRAFKSVQSWTNGNYGTTQTTNYIWDDWNLLREDRPDGSSWRYVWNPVDPLGYRTLLAIADGDGVVHCTETDANGNVVRLHSSAGSSGTTVTAQFEYGPFGESLRATGVKAAACPIRYSSEYFDAETELYYYGHRYYSPRLGRWLSKDPIEEQGGINLYGFVGNQSINKFDVLGLWKIEREGDSKALATAEENDTLRTLASAAGLNVDEYKNWLSKENGNSVTDKIALDSKINKCSKFRVPNTIIAYWGGLCIIKVKSMLIGTAQ